MELNIHEILARMKKMYSSELWVNAINYQKIWKGKSRVETISHRLMSWFAKKIEEIPIFNSGILTK